jgi:hypothetical protein
MIKYGEVRAWSDVHKSRTELTEMETVRPLAGYALLTDEMRGTGSFRN